MSEEKNQAPSQKSRENKKNPSAGTTDADVEDGRANKIGNEAEEAIASSSNPSPKKATEEPPGRVGSAGLSTGTENSQNASLGTRTGETQENPPGNSGQRSTPTGATEQGNTWTGQSELNNDVSQSEGWSGDNTTGQNNLGGTMGDNQSDVGGSSGKQGGMEGEGYGNELGGDQSYDDVMDEDLDQNMEGGMRRDSKRGLGAEK